MRFEKPVRVSISPAGNIAKNVDTLEQAAEILLGDWRGPMGAKHLAARKAVLAAMEAAHDRVKTERARKAFASAADDAGILMPDLRQPEPIPGFGTPRWRGSRK